MAGLGHQPNPKLPTVNLLIKNLGLTSRSQDLGILTVEAGAVLDSFAYLWDPFPIIVGSVLPTDLTLSSLDVMVCAWFYCSFVMLDLLEIPRSSALFCHGAGGERICRKGWAERGN